MWVVRSTMNKHALRLDDKVLEHLIEGAENTRVEFKESLQGTASVRLREAVCAFANDLAGLDQPGIAVIGLKDDGTPADIRITDRMVLGLAEMRSDGNIIPPPTILSEKRRYRGHDIAVLTVYPSDSPPVRYKGLVHIRNGPRRGIATAQEERILNERRRHGNRPFDILPVAGSCHGDLSQHLFVNEYLPKAVDHEFLAANDRSLEERLAAAKMIAALDDERVTMLGLLVIGFNPQRFIPAAYVQFLRIRGHDLAAPIVDEWAIYGTIPVMLSRLDDKLHAHNRRSINITDQDTEHRRETYPMAALQELVRNAMMHRDYETSNAPVRVTWYDDRIEVLSPGGPYGAVSLETFAQPRYTDYRNPNLAESMRVLGYVQRFGIGIPTARRLLSDAGHPELEFRVDHTHVVATVRAIPESMDLVPDSA